MADTSLKGMHTYKAQLGYAYACKYQQVGTPPQQLAACSSSKGSKGALVTLHDPSNIIKSIKSIKSNRTKTQKY